MSFWSFLFADLNFRTSEPKEEGTKPIFEQKDTRENIFGAVKVPWEMEKTILLGTAMCLHTFCSFFVTMPFNAIIGLARLLLAVFSKKLCPPKTLVSTLCEIVTFCFCLSALWFINTSKIYHFIRGQGFVKIYVIYNMVELLLKLAAAFNQDTLFSLRYNTSAKDHSFSVGISIFLLNALASLLHTMLFFVQTLTLNVAVNRSDLALVTLLISNNMTEIKSQVMKRFEPENTLQICFADSVERCQIILFLGVVTMNNFGSLHWNITNNKDAVVKIIFSIVTVWFFELTVDSTKHFFFSKFNNFKRNIYSLFRRVFYNDIIQSRLKNDFMVMTDRFGVVPVPLCAVVFKSVISSVIKAVHSFGEILNIFSIVWMCLFGCVIILRTIFWFVLRKGTNGAMKISPDGIEPFLNTQRFAMAKGRVPG